MDTTVQEKPAQDPSERVHALVEEVKAGVASVLNSEDWMRWLDASSKFWLYSFYNQMLIAIQRPSATTVAGFQTWKGFGRHVKQGEHGIRILAPVLVKTKKDEEDTEKVLRGFRSVCVFDVAQTEGKELPTLYHPLKGSAPEGMFDTLKGFAESSGYSVRFGQMGEGKYGYLNSTNEIVLKEGEEMAQSLDVLCHELSHALLGHLQDNGRSLEEKELEAETSAWIVCRNLGLETRSVSFAYLASWARGKERDAMLERAAHRACEVARKILEGVSAS